MMEVWCCSGPSAMGERWISFQGLVLFGLLGLAGKVKVMPFLGKKFFVGS
jgi:hypothetical protein